MSWCQLGCDSGWLTYAGSDLPTPCPNCKPDLRCCPRCGAWQAKAMAHSCPKSKATNGIPMPGRVRTILNQAVEDAHEAARARAQSEALRQSRTQVQDREP